MDRGFTTYNLVKHLLDYNIEVIGTANDRFLFVPDELKSHRKSGNIISMKNNNIRLYQFQDGKRNVLFLSSSSKEFNYVKIESKLDIILNKSKIKREKQINKMEKKLEKKLAKLGKKKHLYHLKILEKNDERVSGIYSIKKTTNHHQKKIMFVK